MVKIVKRCPSCNSLFICSNRNEDCEVAKICVCGECLSTNRDGCHIKILRSGSRLREDTS